MSEALVLGGVEARGVATVREVEVPGMVTLKATLDRSEVARAVEAVTGCAMPGRRGIVTQGGKAVAWMAPDEALLMMPRPEVAAALRTLSDALSGTHHLTADVSDMRAMFRIEGGNAARETLAKLCPVDLAPGVFEAGEIRRTRLSQIPAAFWWAEDGFTLVCFRSVARYAFDVLRGAGAEGGEVGHFGRSLEAR